MNKIIHAQWDLGHQRTGIPMVHDGFHSTPTPINLTRDVTQIDFSARHCGYYFLIPHNRRTSMFARSVPANRRVIVAWNCVYLLVEKCGCGVGGLGRKHCSLTLSIKCSDPS